MLIQGTLVKITGFLQLTIKIDEQTFTKLKSQNLKVWSYEESFYARVNLNSYDKQVIKLKFEPLVKQPVVIKAAARTFTPKPTEENPSPSAVLYMELQTIYKANSKI